MKRNLWNCDRCGAEFEYTCEWGEQPINYVASGGPPRKADLCSVCSAQFERWLAGAELAIEPPVVLAVIRGENDESSDNAESIIEVQHETSLSNKHSSPRS